MKFKLIVASALLALGLVSPAMAHPVFPVAYPTFARGWELIGARDVSFRAERDTIPAWGRDRYSQIKICVYRQPVRMYDVDVYFHNGGHQDVGVRNVIGDGQCTRAIDLNGNRRNIRSVALAYQSLPTFRHVDRALVRVYAR